MLLRLGFGADYIGLNDATMLSSLMAVSPLFGLLAARIGLRPMMVGGLAIGAASIMAMPVPAPAGVPRPAAQRAPAPVSRR